MLRSERMSQPAFTFSTWSKRSRKIVILSRAFPAVVIAGVALRILLVLFAGGGIRTPWGGGGDAPAYVTLARNLVAGKGYGYSGHPTAFRPPAYPLLLSVSVRLFSQHALAAVRGLQFVEGLAVVFLCGEVARRMFGEEARKATLVIALFLPSLVLTTGEILTETTATFLSAVFLFFLVQHLEVPRWLTILGMSVTVGLAAMVRFNMALLGFVVLWVVLTRKTNLSAWRGAAVAVLVPGLVVSPWLIRNLVVFHGSALFSTQGGAAAVLGVLTPQGRALPGDSERLSQALGWIPPMELETNDASRDGLAEEPALNKQCWAVALKLWRDAGWGLMPLTLRKLSYFWLSTDQLFWTAAFPPLQRLIRGAGVVVYWVLLALAIGGWLQLESRKSPWSYPLLFYAVLVTVMHIPFTMNTRLRVPFIDPLVAVLAGIGVVTLWRWEKAGGANGARKPCVEEPILGQFLRHG